MFGFKTKQQKQTARALYKALQAQARSTVFYTDYGVPDTLDGRFDLLVLHAFLVIYRLESEGRSGHKYAQALFDVMFRDMELNLREAGIGDLSVPKHVKRMMRGFNGRRAAYADSIKNVQDIDIMVETLNRNLYASGLGVTQEEVSDMAAYVIDSHAALAKQGFDDIKTGKINFITVSCKKKDKQDGNIGMAA